MAKEITLSLPDDLFAKIQAEAARLNKLMQQLALDILVEWLSSRQRPQANIKPEQINGWTLWQKGEVRKVVYVEKAYVASWDAKGAESQKRLLKYLTGVSQEIGVLPPNSNLFLHMDIGVSQKNLLSNHDVENYLTPLVKHLGARDFVFVSGEKYVGNASLITIGIAQTRNIQLESGWQFCPHQTTKSVQSKEWKVGVRDTLLTSKIAELPDGEAEVILAWRGSPRRNWVSLWKPTGDTMGPVLGYTYNDSKPFYPKDDRITYLECHWFPDSTFKHNVEIGMWWRKKP